MTAATPTSPPPWKASLRLIWPLAGFKLLTLLLVYWSLILIPMPFNQKSYELNFHWPEDEPLNIAMGYKTWDAQHYLFISQFGYDKVAKRVFYPLWPAVIRLSTIICGGNALIASLIASNLLSLSALLMLHRLALLRNDPGSADVTVLLALVFPTAFFTSLPYSESLFLFLAVGLFLAMQANRPALIWLAGALLPLTRAVGFICICPIIVDQLAKRRFRMAALLLTGPLAGAAAYFVVFKIMTGDATAGLSATMHTTVTQPLRLLHPLQFLQFFFASNLQTHGIFNSAIDRAAFIVVIASLWPMIRRHPADAAFCIPAAIIPAVGNAMMSFTRFALVLFPVFLVGGRLLSPPNRRWWLWLICALSLSLQIILLIRHVHFDWAG